VGRGILFLRVVCDLSKDGLAADDAVLLADAEAGRDVSVGVGDGELGGSGAWDGYRVCSSEGQAYINTPYKLHFLTHEETLTNTYQTHTNT
jgi:hypothetical protein